MSEHCKAPVQDDQPVLVDQRALINKVLARYPRDFTLFRELLQNSDDAGSSIVEIHFKTAGGLEEGNDVPLSHSKPSHIAQWTFKNNGKPFEGKDWGRLTRIAVGNPDPQKVGAFGVGFYSIFSATDGPVVSSDGQRMEFYWRGEQLYFRKRDVPKEDWTVFEIPLRMPAPMLEVVKFMQFLATSITFMVKLREVRLFLDEGHIGCIRKSDQLVGDVDLPITLEHLGPLNMMIMGGLHRHQFTIQANISAKLAEPSKKHTTSPSQSPPHSHSPSQLQTASHAGYYAGKLDLTIFTVKVTTKMIKELSEGLLRCMNKTPPSPIMYSLVYTGKDEHDPVSADQENPSLLSIFQGLRANLSGASHSKIFIGHPTSQTTGFGGHLASHFIPTVERESIDLADRDVATWNNELLNIGGFLSRAVYELQLSDIQSKWKEAIQFSKASDLRPSNVFQDQLREYFNHVVRFFTFHPSTPSPRVAQELQHSFYTCSNLSPRLLSSVGVRRSSEIRLFDSLCDKFLKHVPMLARDIAEDFIKALPDRHKIRTITHSDVVRDLQGRTLNEGEVIACLQWQIQHGSTGMAELFEEARFQDAGGVSVQLSSIQHFVDPNGPGNYIPVDGPLPRSLIPRQITKHFTLDQLAKFGWKEFTIVDWLQYISGSQIRSANPRYDFTQSSGWADDVLRSLSSAWSSSNEIRRVAKSLLSNETCIPTTCGLCVPKDSFLPSMNIPTSDEAYPIVQLGHGINLDVLKFLGVQQHLPPRILIKMLESGKWKTFNLINYLVPVASNLKEDDLYDLTSCNAFEGFQKGNDRTRFHIGELYPPMEVFGKLHLPQIDLEKGSSWQDSSAEAALLYRLGLQHFPSLDVIMKLCSDSEDPTVMNNAFEYLCSNLRSVYSGCNLDGFRDIAYIPAENKEGPLLEKPGNVFLDKQWKIFGCSVVRRGLQEGILEELGVRQHPPSSLLIEILKDNPPSDEAIARSWFEILSNHVSSFEKGRELETLSQLPIVPDTISGDRKQLVPAQCYLKKDVKDDLYSKLFHFVNFSEAACTFLRACGAKDRPSEEDIAKSLIDDPKRFYDLTGGPERYLQELRHLADGQKAITNETISKMRASPVLLGAPREKIMNPDGWKNTKQYRPEEIVIVDDIQASQLFADSIIAAPRDMSPDLENFYESLGCRYLTRVVSEYPHPRSEQNVPMGPKIQGLVSQRLPLFLRHSPLPQHKTSKHRLQALSASDITITVTVWEHLLVRKVLTIGEKPVESIRSVWATAKCEQGRIELLLSCSAKEDKYELAVSLCRELFGAVKLSDALLLSTILSEDTDVLRQRGYEVDQALQPQQYLNSGPNDGASLCSSDPPKISDHRVIESVPPSMMTEKGLEPEGSQVPSTDQSHLRGVGTTVSGSLAASSFAISEVIRRVSNNVRDVTRNIVSSVEPSDAVTMLPWDPCRVMPRRHIQSTVGDLIRACGSDQPITPGDAGGMKSWGERYCKGPIENLHPFRVRDMDIYIGQGKETLMRMEGKPKRLAEFVHVITPIANIYALPVASWRVFYDRTAGCIAFNRNKTLYLNFWYFEVWHYQGVKKGNRRQALTSWFLTLAHEIAHNLVNDHNSEHEFWFLAICEAHMDKFSDLLGSLPVPK